MSRAGHDRRDAHGVCKQQRQARYPDQKQPQYWLGTKWESQALARALCRSVLLPCARAVLPGGEQVIVKVQRPGIEEMVECDLSILARLARRIEAHTAWGAAYGVCELAAEFAGNLRAELDFAAEARNMTEMAAGLDDVPEIAVPAVFADLSTLRVLVMEELQGVSVSAARLRQPEVDGRELADILLRSALRLMMGGERFHADPHPRERVAAR